MKTFKYVVFMDDVYKEDGNITDMWWLYGKEKNVRRVVKSFRYRLHYSK
jgi:hypothetical protein